MAFQVNTNIGAMNAHAQSVFTQGKLKNSLEKLSSGLRINKAADDASGMVIADSLRSQAASLGQAIKNANDGIGIIQIADKAMDEQIKILETIKVKATQAAQDGQSAESRRAIQNDIARLIQGLDNIGNTTSYNGISLLSGSFTNKEFQIGAYSNQTIRASIGATTSDKIGQVRVETGANVSGASVVSLTFKQADGANDVTLQSVVVSHSAGTGLGALAEVINKNSDRTGIKAQANVQSTSDESIKAGDIKGLSINGVVFGDIIGIQANDADGRLAAAINASTSDTGVEAFIDNLGRLNLRSVDGRGIYIKAAEDPNAAVTSLNGGQSLGAGSSNYGRLSLTRLDARDIQVVSAPGISGGSNFASIGFGVGQVAETTVNLRDVMGEFGASVRSAAGGNQNAVIASGATGLGAGVTTLIGAMVVMNIAESAQKTLDKVRADMGSVQNQMTSTMDNITVTQVNVKAAESQIRDVDFAAESSDFSKYSILAQSGSYALSQANALQQNILRLLS
ncbi:flagellin A [Helicobacter kayseriensis]|uniref:flagellin A n=1 Tax=Helicobacter kayseriensis TaxID=2905877 RepID=UPI001E4623AC|nr:flagellin A [Helicobacter kayseriensis]MCE3047726.1 flagellin A [Helicobacter kayseriensis]MCE3049123.1 flagellin A [Helicobacter kayseriensis]